MIIFINVLTQILWLMLNIQLLSNIRALSMAAFKIFIFLNYLGVHIHWNILKKTCRLSIFLVVLHISSVLMRWFDCKQWPLRGWIDLFDLIVIFTLERIWIRLILYLLIKWGPVLVLYDIAAEKACIIVFVLGIVLNCWWRPLLCRICTNALLVHLGMKYLFLLLCPVLRIVLNVYRLVRLFLRTVEILLVVGIIVRW